MKSEAGGRWYEGVGVGVCILAIAPTCHPPRQNCQTDPKESPK
jgi:hypothetical protein